MSSMNPTKSDVTIIIPVCNEEATLYTLYEQLASVMRRCSNRYEIIMIDDGSTDGSWDQMRNLAQEHAACKAVRFTKNFGQTAALAAGFSMASTSVVITIDADMQNDPADIPRILEKLAQGYDIVSGWRKDRRDPWLRSVMSKAANNMISWVTGLRLKDYGCTLKAYRSQMLQNLHLYGEMHRFLPAYLWLHGARITEVPVTHHPRKHGRSKYGFERILKVVLDLLTAKFFASFISKPIYIFGGTGILLGMGGIAVGCVVLYHKYAMGVWAHKNPLLLLAMFLGLLGMQFVALGLIAEVIIRSYYEIKDRKIYVIREHVT